ALLRRLWTEELVDFSGRYHTVRGAGLNPLPVQRPIPIWMGGSAEPALRRIARLADGWIPEVRPEQDAEAAVARMRQYLAAAGRDPSRFGIEGRIRLARTPREEWPQAVQMWQRLGATHLSVDTMRAGLAGPRDHLLVLESFLRALA
ncbi:MAG: LLM class flavin-dependent oxidoreductase, partial [Armatimonadota bacterium]|nr:LLM class flavin-dependent oxidoreductase [Armatimonadota bacterium]